MQPQDPLPRLADALNQVGTQLHAISAELRTLADQPAAQAAAESAQLHVAQSSPQLMQPTAQAGTQPGAQPMPQPVTQPAPQSALQPITPVGAHPMPQPGAQQGARPMPQQAVQPIAQAGPHGMAQSAPQPGQQPGQQLGPMPYPVPMPVQPWAGPQPMPSLPLMPPPAPMRPPGPTLWQRLSQDGAGSRLLAWVGGAVTLLGVVLLLVLAIQRGYLGPLGRTLLGAALGITLAGAGVRLHRTPANRVGALAVAATGFAVVYLDLIAATTLYHYLPSWLGLLAGLLVVGAGLLLADRWETQLFAVFVVVACASCAPALTSGFTPLLLGFLLVLMAATTPVLLRRGWPGLALAAGLPPVIASTVTILVARTALHPPTPKITAALLGVATTALVIALATATVVRRPQGDQLPGLLAAAVAPGLLAATLVPRLPAAGLAVIVAGLLLIVWLADRSGLLDLPERFVLVAGIGSALALFEATMLTAHGRGLAPVLLGEALLFGLIAWRSRGKDVLLAALVFGTIGVLNAMGRALPLEYLTRPPRVEPQLGTLATAAGTGVLVVAVVAVLLAAATRLGVLPGPDSQPVPWLTGAAAGLYGASGTVLTIGLLIAPDRAGFLAGHVLVTISWTVTALILLLRGIDHLPLRVTGLVLTGAALAKLVLFDLSSLDGLARVAAFLGAGLVLLAAGARYARLVAGRH